MRTCILILASFVLMGCRQPQAAKPEDPLILFAFKHPEFFRTDLVNGDSEVRLRKLKLAIRNADKVTTSSRGRSLVVTNVGPEAKAVVEAISSAIVQGDSTQSMYDCAVLFYRGTNVLARVTLGSNSKFRLFPANTFHVVKVPNVGFIDMRASDECLATNDVLEKLWESANQVTIKDQVF